MRPVRLQLAGFTAFRDPQELDFEALDLFAVTGPTGSGKSSLLDAVTYALFGKAPRVGKGVNQLVSQGQPRLRVLFEFDVDAERYRVARETPARAKGATSVRVERLLRGDWTSLGEGADRVTEGTKMIEGLIGLDYEAFTRSVLLPQGTFAEFLTGDARERRSILTELLGLELFERMAKRAGELSRSAKTVAQAKADVLATQYAQVDAARLKEAKAASKAARARSDEVAGAERSLQELAKEWDATARRVEALDGLATDADGLAGEAASTADDLQGLSEEMTEAQAKVVQAEQLAKGQEESARSAASALAEGRERVGTLEKLAGLRAGMQELGRIRDRLRAAGDGVEAATAEVEARDRALKAAGAAAEDAGAALEEATKDLQKAEEQHDLAVEHDMVGALIKGRKVGERCPVCSRPLLELPKVSAKELKAAAYQLTRAKEAEKSAANLWSKRDRDHSLAERDATHAREGLERCRTDLADIERDQATLRESVAAFFEGTLPEDPLGDVESRIDELRALEDEVERTSGIAAIAAKEALAARTVATSVAGRGLELTARLRAIPIAALLERVQRVGAEVEIGPAFSAAVPADQTEVVAVARSWAEDADRLAASLRASAKEEQAGLDELLRRARQSVPAEVDLAGMEGLDDLVSAVRGAAQDLLVRATKLQSDAETLAARLKERRDLEKDVEARTKEGAVYHALAGELRADRLMSFLQSEALELLAAAGSERLLFLSQGRYRLAFEDDEFYVEDRQNGDERRSVRTLSGGETFLASLALALALSEQIQALAVTPKARLGSLFIDEGFGALDQESLEVATEALSQLGGEERMVGVITHVRELAERLPIQVVVERNPRGSRIVIAS